jgi:hypothetical protein
LTPIFFDFIRDDSLYQRHPRPIDELFAANINCRSVCAIETRSNWTPDRTGPQTGRLNKSPHTVHAFANPINAAIKQIWRGMKGSLGEGDHGGKEYQEYQ